MLKRTGIIALILAVAVCASLAEEKPELRRLQFEASPATSATLTPARLSDKVRQVRIGAKGKLSIGGRELDFAGAFLGTGHALILDCDDDGKAAASEQVTVDLRNSASFRLHLPAAPGKIRDYAVRFYAVRVHVTNNAVTGVDAHLINQGCMATTFQGVPIRIFDEDLDGTFSQDGKDAIAIGPAGCAMPLLKDHQVGRQFYRLNVDPNGSSVTFEPSAEKSTGLVRLLPPLSGAAAVILADTAAGRAYDVAGGAEIPEGLYRLSYAVLRGSGRTVFAVGGERSDAFEIKSKNINTPRLGGPLTIDFSARQTYQSIEVAPEIRVWGAAGEEYKFDLAGLRPLGDARVAFCNGRSVLSSGNLAYIDDRIPQKYADWIPAGMTKSAGRVVLSTTIPLLGEASGARSMEEVLSGARTPPDVAKGPTVIHKPLGGAEKPPEAKPADPKPAPEKPAAPAPVVRPEDSRPGKPLTEENLAEAMLMSAEVMLKGGNKADAVARLNELIAKYPKSDAALRAGDLLQRMKEKEEEDRDRQ